MPEFAIRHATSNDAPALARLGEATFRETFLDDFAIPYPAEDLAVFIAATYSVAVFKAMLSDPAQTAWIAHVAGGEAAAYCVVGPCGLPHPDARPSHGELKRLYVARAHQGLGLGRALFALALDRLSLLPGPSWIGVWSGNLKAQRFYAQAGFAKAGDYEFPVGRWRDHEFILRRDASVELNHA
jgi:ribosomal protein S18 acetylase RimI-like enzyme